MHLAQAELKQRLYTEEAFWKQKANIKWDLDGDKNSSLFFTPA